MDLHKFDQPIPAITTPYSYTPESNYAKDLERWILTHFSWAFFIFKVQRMGWMDVFISLRNIAEPILNSII